MKNLSFKNAWPYLVAIAIFLVLSLVFFYPILEGKQIFQSDIVHFKGMSKEIVDYRNQTGEEALWTNSMFGGMPAYQISVLYKGNLLGFLNSVITLGLPFPANILFLYFIGFFVLLLVLKVNRWLAVAGAIGFAFSSFFLIVIDAGHNSQAFAIGYMAFVMAGIILTMRKNYIWGGILAAVALSLEVKQNHPQITYYLLMTVVLFGIAELVAAFREKRLASYFTSVAVLAVAGIFALLTNLTVLWATYEYGKYTIRGKTELTTEKDNRTSGLDKDYATQWSYGVGETMTLLIPDYNGGASSQKLSKNSEIAKALRANNIPENTVEQFINQPFSFMYWGTQPFTSGPVYVGAIICFLFVLGLMVVKGPMKWWLLAATILSILLSWGHNFMAFTEFFMKYVPGYNKFRAVSMTLVIAEFTMPLLGLLALKELFDPANDRKKLLKALQIAAGIVGGITLIFALMPGAFLSFVGPNDTAIAKNYQFPDWFMQALRDERLRLLRMDALRGLAFILMTGAVIWAVVYGRLKKEYGYLLLGVFILLDMYPVAKRYLNEDSFVSKSRNEAPFEMTQADQLILKDTTRDYRVYNLTVNPFMDASTSYYHESIGGYHGAKLRRYQELIENQILKNNMSVMDMLNTKYFIVPDENRNPSVQVNPNALGNAWFVRGVKLVDNADQELAALDKFTPADTAIVDRSFSGLLKDYSGGRDSLDHITMTAYKPNKLDYSYTSAKPGLAVFSEIYYPKGWNAYVDGTPAAHFRANYVLRAMVLPAGTHTVEFRFEPKAYYAGEKISKSSSIILILLILGAGGWDLYRRLRTRE